MQRNTLAALIAGLSTLPVQAQEAPLLDEIVVTATRFPTPDVLAPYASEVHIRSMIEQSGSSTLYDYLAQHSSVQILPNYGNKFTPKIDMRGYGIGDGYQNIVITVDGRRLNNIDLGSQLIGAIPLADIERIEITKGSGSVMFGDGATAGSIQIVTRKHEGVSLQASAGNFGALAGTVTAGLKKERVSLNASADYSSADGYSDADVTGFKDASSNRTWRGGLELRPVDRLKLGLDLASTRIKTRYIGPLTLAAFDTDPRQNSGNTYTPQIFGSDLWRVQARLEFTKNWNLSASHGVENKRSAYLNGWGVSDYDYTADDLDVQYRGGDFDFTAGVQTFDGVRIGATNRTSKNNTGWFAQGQYRFGKTTLSAGARAENVEYIYTPAAGALDKADHDLSVWDIGVNQRLDERLSLFANYNRAFQSSDIDRFFNFGGGFNGFIAPAISHTLNLGFNHVTSANRLKLTLFHSQVDNEIFYNALTFTNTNLAETHKYGLELQDTWRITEPFSVNLNYAYTRAIIDRSGQNVAYDGKDLPGVPKHSVNLGLAYQLSAAASVNLSQTWRSSAFAAEDFANTFTQKQAAYQSTDIAWRYRHNKLEWFAAVENLFEQKNGLWIHDDAIYPVNFTRNWRLGMKATF
jgi:iron complex outermembrane receptor protein